MTPEEIAIAALIGLAAGLLGGLAGIGGSLIMIPGLGVLFGYPSDGAQHIYMASAMCVNVAVAFPAARRHHKAGAVRFDLVKILLPSMAIFIIIGVLTSNQDSGAFLRQLLAAFIALYCILNIIRVFKGKPKTPELQPKPSCLRLIGIGAATGFIAGLLGIGGGILVVPMLQIFCRVPLRNAIGTSSAVMVLTALVGSILKVSTLHTRGLDPRDALLLAAVMAPLAIIGAPIGASLTHRLPLNAVRITISVMLLAAAARLAGII